MTLVPLLFFVLVFALIATGLIILCFDAISLIQLHVQSVLVFLKPVVMCYLIALLLILHGTCVSMPLTVLAVRFLLLFLLGMCRPSVRLIVPMHFVSRQIT